MDSTLYENSPVGQLVPISGSDPRYNEQYDAFAFLPAALPEEVTFSAKTWLVITQASQALGRLDQAGRALPRPGLLTYPQIRREAQSTSELEGTFAAFSELLEVEIDGSPASAEVQEVLNYVKAAEAGYQAIAERPITLDLLRALQELLIAGTRSDGPQTGQVRSTQVLIGPEGCRIQDARFVPCPPGDHLEAGLRDWEAWVGGERDMPLIAQVALAHYQFETLHPFSDGNGRIGRLAMVMQLMRGGHLAHPLLTLSPWLVARRNEYQDHLALVSQSGDFDRWTRFIATSIRDQALAGVSKVERLLAFQSSIAVSVRENRIRGIGRDIAQDLIAFPLVTATFSAGRYGKTYNSANSAIKRLVEIGLLEQSNSGSYGRMFVCNEVLTLIEF